jgi:ABC-2 type transport system ATP-binding protein
VFSLLGPNGAGKTTMVRILATLVRADAGRARVAGYDVVHERRRVRQNISLTGQYAAVDDLQTGAENLRMMGRLAGLSARDSGRRAAQLLDRFDLTDAGGRRLKTYSGGMRRRLDLAASLVGQPAVIFLDEPTTGLDLRSRQAMWQVIKDLAGSGVTVFLTTQYLEEADHLADRIAVLDTGRIVAEGSPEQLKRQFGDQRLELTLAEHDTYDRVARQLADQVTQRDPDRLSVSVATDGSSAHVRALLDEVDPDRRSVQRFDLHSATLDDVFLALTGRVATPTESDIKPQKETVGV